MLRLSRLSCSLCSFLMDPSSQRLTSILLLLLAFPLQAHTFPANSFRFGSPFNPSHDYDTFAVLPPATISNGALQVTPDSSNSNFALSNRSSRIFFNRSFNLWQANSSLASFNTSFLINIFRFNNTIPGEGFAFLIAPDLTVPTNSAGKYLGLTNDTMDGDSSNGIVAVELDTFKDGDFDPDDNHMGLNLHSVRSNKTVSLTQFGIQIAPVEPTNHTVWIQYDGNEKTIRAYMAEQGKGMPDEPLLTSFLDLRQHVSQSSYFGFAASTGANIQLNCVLGWNLTVEILPGSGNGGEEKVRIWVPVGAVLAALLVIGAASLAYYCVRRKRAKQDPTLLGALKSLPGMPREFGFKDLKKATGNFDEKHKLGQGGFGVVYRGVLPNENILVAVKKFSRDNMKGQDDFLSELTIINRLRHKHLVRLLGWCHENGVLLLVYDYMPNGSLDKHLFHEDESKSVLEWNLRYKIVSGVASALHYLHHEYDQKVLHRDLKASNIMLDSEFNARLGDFGLARCLENEKTSYADQLEGVPGTLGYIAPECFHTGKATRESDVYAFGAVLLEVVCGQRPWTKIDGFQFLVDWVWFLHREGRILDAVDEKLGGKYVAEEAQRLLLLGLACSHPIATERPKTQAIFQIVSGTVAVPRVPPFKPAFVWPAFTGGLSVDATAGTSADTTPITSGWTPQCVSPDSYSAERYTDSSLL